MTSSPASSCLGKYVFRIWNPEAIDLSFECLKLLLYGSIPIVILFYLPMIIKEIDFYTGSKKIETFPAACKASYSTVS